MKSTHSTVLSRSAPLGRALAELATRRVIPGAGAILENTRPAVEQVLGEAVLAEVPAYSTSGNPEILPGLAQHAGDHIREVMRLCGGGELSDFAFVASHAQLRAEQRFPLEAALHAYRCGHRVIANWVREAAIVAGAGNQEAAVAAAADFAIEYTNVISTIMASEYVAHTRALAESEGDQRTELLNILLSGYDESDGRVARLLKSAGYLEQRQSYCVAVAQPVNPGEMEHPGRAQRIVSAMADAVAGTSVRMLAGVRNNLVTAVLSDRRRQSGWTAPQAVLALRIEPLLQMLGPAVLVGISGDHPSTSFVPKALSEAQTALEFAGVANRVARFSGLPLRSLLLHRGTESMQSTAPGWAQDLFRADEKAGGALVQTLRALADASLNVQDAARRLGKHPNTIYARLERISDVTGLDGQRYHDLTELLLAADCWRTRRT